MNLKVQALKNVGSSWAGLGVNIAVGFFLSPFILHRLGDDAFGLWVLIYSITGYYGLFDFGIRSSIVRYVSKYTALNDSEELNHLLNTSLVAYSAVAVILLLLTGAGSLYVDRFFRIPASFHATAQIIFLVVGSALSLGFPLSIFGGILEGLQKFYVLNIAQIISTLLRALLIIVALTHGGGLISVAAITVGLPLLAAAAYAVIVLRILPLGFGRHFIDKKSFREVANYGAVTFMILVAARLRYRADAVVIGTFLSAAAITYFTIGARLVDYASDVVTSLAQIFTPMSSHFHSTGDFQKLRRIFIAGNRACALVMLPICTMLILLGKSVITVWVGPQYISSYIILLILLIPATVYGIQASSNKILFGMSKHRSLAVVVLMEGLVNVGLSIYLVRRIGIVGDALGSGVPMLCTAVFFLPRHMCRLLQVPLRRYLRDSYFLPMMMCLPLALSLWLMQRWFQVHNYFQLLLQLAVGGLVYGICLLWFFVTHETEGVQLRTRVAGWFGPHETDSTGPDLEDEVVTLAVSTGIEVPRSWARQAVRSIAHRIVPQRLLQEREGYVRLGSSARRIYCRLRLMDLIGLRWQSRRKLPPGAHSFLFVCHGNIMRSPMSEALFRRALAASRNTRHTEHWSVRSAGLHAIAGREVHPWGQIAADELGISLRDHRAQLLTRELVEGADAIFVMDFHNKAELLACYPEAGSKVFMLSEYADRPLRGREIRDPFHGDEDATRSCYDILQTCIRNLINELFLYSGPSESDAVLTGDKAFSTDLDEVSRGRPPISGAHIPEP